MTKPAQDPAPAIVLASPEAADALRALGLDSQPHGRLLRAETGDAEAAMAALRPVAADWCVRAADAPLPAVFVSDMDSSIIGQECIDELADFAGRKDEVAAITRRAMAGELDFAAALGERVAALAGQDEAILDRCYHERVRLNPGAAELTGALNRAGMITALVSGGFDAIATRVAADAGFARSAANTLVIRDGLLTGTVTDPIVDGSAKALYLKALLAEAGAPLERGMAMGDGANDIPMLSAAGLAIAIGGKPPVLAVCNAAVRRGDLSIVADFLGLV